MAKLDSQINALKEELVDFRRALHRCPEPGFQEHRTAASVAQYLQELGLETQTGIGGTGVIAVLRGANAGPTIALRACLDALAVEERSGVEYASEHSGFMHACGHDGNMTMVLGAARVLTAHRQRLNGSVKFIFQPSEENTGGAAAVIKAGGLKDPDVSAIVTPHNWPGYRQGVLVVKPGPVMASSDLFELKIIGKPGHGAWPHLAVDPVVVAAEVISALQHITSREIDPLETAVISIGKISGGTAANIIPEAVTLEGTVRAFNPAVRDFIQTRVEEIARGVTQSARAAYQLTYERVMPPVHNDPDLTALAYAALKAAFEPGMVTDDFTPTMGCEEFSLFQEKIPGLFLFIGNDFEGREMVPLHAPDYVFNDAILPVGVKALCEIVLGYCGSGG